MGNGNGRSEMKQHPNSYIQHRRPFHKYFIKLQGKSQEQRQGGEEIPWGQSTRNQACMEALAIAIASIIVAFLNHL